MKLTKIHHIRYIMYFSFAQNKGKPIAKIYTPIEVENSHCDDEPEDIKKKGKHKSKLPKRWLGLVEEEGDGPDRVKEFKVNGKDKLQPLMCRQLNGHANRVFCAGGTLSGKSFMAGKLARDYQKNFPKNKVVLFSWVKEDKAYEKIKNLHKIRVDESILEDPIDLDELHDSVCIFDDITAFSDKHILAELERLEKAALKTGRHSNIDVIIARQELLDGSKTKPIIGNCFQVIAYPHSAGRYQLSEWLRRYMRLDKVLINKILNVPSRWVLINRATPAYCLFEKGAFMLT